MNVLIIEDEIPARARLIQILTKLDARIEIVAQLASARAAIRWLESNPSPDLAFVDIHLSDDSSFSIFQQCDITFPVVFTTAYDKYLMESFEYNSIDYLLKPVTETKLKRALEKVRRLESHFAKRNLEEPRFEQAAPVERIVARKGADFVCLDSVDIAYFYTAHKIVFVRDHSGRILIVDRTLAELEELLKPHNFFRLNRKYLVHAGAIEKYRPDNGKILVQLRPPVDESVHISKETAPFFRRWMATGKLIMRSEDRSEPGQKV